MILFLNRYWLVAGLVTLVATGNTRAQTIAQNTGAAASASAGQINLGPVNVEAAAPAAENPPTSSSSVSRQQLQDIPPTVPSDILTGIPGVFSQYDGGPGLSVSVRGMQDFGRVNVMIDGARQDFQVTGHGANGTVYIDPALLSGVDVTRGTVSTAYGVGAIGGVVNLRTIGIDDILAPGWRYGVMTTDMYGTNNYDGSGMIAAGARLTDQVDMVAALSLRNSGDYKAGNGDIVPGTFQHLLSGLVKTDIAPGPDQTLQLGAIVYHNAFANSASGLLAPATIDSTTVTAKYHWAPSAWPAIDVHVNGFYADTQLVEDSPPFVGVTMAPADTTHYHLTTLGFEANNTSRFFLGPVAVALDYGGEYNHDRVSTADLTGAAGATPSGDRGLGGLFVQANLAWWIFQLTPAVRYDIYTLSGSGVNETGGFTNVPVGPFNVSKWASAVSPKITLAATPLPGLQFYGSYGRGFRPPAITETLFSGAHPGLDFLRFVPNPDLVPERTDGAEVGVKLGYHDLLRQGDGLTLQADLFQTRIEHYIAQTLVESGQLDPNLPFPIPLDGYFFQNTIGTTRTQGVEFQAGYDARVVFTNLSYANTITKLGTPDYTGFDAILTAPPRSVFAATFGVRFFDGQLVIGERTRAVSATQGQPSLETGQITTIPGYVVEDLFASYRITPALRAFAAIDNVGNKQYFIDALASAPSPGLTAKIGLTLALGR